MTEHDDLEVLGASGADCKPGESGDEAVENARHNPQASAAFPLVNPHGRIFDPHRLATATFLDLNATPVGAISNNDVYELVMRVADQHLELDELATELQRLCSSQ